MAGQGIIVYLDENIDLRLADALRRRGHDALHAFEVGNRKVADDEHIRYATRCGRAVVTHNFGDYARHHADFLSRSETHEGIILVPQRSFSELLTRISNHLDQYTPDEQRNNLFWA